MVRVVERRADEIVHAGVGDDEGLGLGLGPVFLDIEDAGQECARLSDDEATGLEE